MEEGTDDSGPSNEHECDVRNNCETSENVAINDSNNRPDDKESRKRPREDDSDQSDVDNDDDHHSNSSSWEDQESSDDAKLKIDVPKKKEVP